MFITACHAGSIYKRKNEQTVMAAYWFCNAGYTIWKIILIVEGNTFDLFIEDHGSAHSAHNCREFQPVFLLPPKRFLNYADPVFKTAYNKIFV